MQTLEQIEKQVIDLVSEHLGIDEKDITSASSLADDLGADSLDTMDLIMAMHETFDIKIKDKEIEGLKTINDIVQLVHSKVED
jgi:acyl carrier protein